MSGGRQQMYVDDSEECQLHEFKVVSWNDAGDSEPEVITETLPISESGPQVLVVAWARVPHRICWHSYDVQPEGRRPEGLHHNCANISCVSTRAHATTNLLPFLWFPSP